MAGAGDHSRSLKEALVESLNAILSPIHNVRISGEEQVKALEVTEGNYYVTDTKLIDVSCHTCFFSFEKKKQQNINVIFIQRFTFLRFELLKFILRFNFLIQFIINGIFQSDRTGRTDRIFSQKSCWLYWYRSSMVSVSFVTHMMNVYTISINKRNLLSF